MLMCFLAHRKYDVVSQRDFHLMWFLFEWIEDITLFRMIQENPLKQINVDPVTTALLLRITNCKNICWIDWVAWHKRRGQLLHFVNPISWCDQTFTFHIDWFMQSLRPNEMRIELKPKSLAYSVHQFSTKITPLFGCAIRNMSRIAEGNWEKFNYSSCFFLLSFE